MIILIVNILYVDLLSGYAQIRANTLGRTLNSYMETSVSRKQAFAPCMLITLL